MVMPSGTARPDALPRDAGGAQRDDASQAATHDASATLGAAPIDTRLSIVVPLFDEEDNVGHLVQAIHDALADCPWPWELVAVDDGSNDGTLARLLLERAQRGAHVRVLALRRNHGQTAAMRTGIDAARGTLIATLDGDLQNDPRDVPKLARHLFERDLDVVAGWRKDRQDKLITRKIPSRIANTLIGRLTGVRLHDYGCTLKVFRADVLKQVRLFGEMHRFIPAWLVMVTPAKRIAELPVNHMARVHGRSKYGLWRTVHVLLDLLVVVFFQRFRSRPGHFFGLLGLVLGGLGGAALAWLAYLKFLLGESIGGRPLLVVGVMCALAGLQLVTTGVLAEIMLRMGPSHGHDVAVDMRFADAPAGWKTPT